MEATFAPLPALAGGILIGLSAVLLLATTGRIAGISGIVGGLLTPAANDIGWRVAFVIGVIAGPVAAGALTGNTLTVTVTSSTGVLVAAGLLVGYGTRLGGGCTSGHGVCGLARLSPRSLAATGTFLASAMLTVYIVRHLAGG